MKTVRLLIDCGFDFIELIAGSITQLKPDCWIEFESDISICLTWHKSPSEMRAADEAMGFPPSHSCLGIGFLIGALGIDAC